MISKEEVRKYLIEMYAELNNSDKWYKKVTAILDAIDNQPQHTSKEQTPTQSLEELRDEIIYKLFKALDDIDTTSDIYKANYKERCNHIDEIIKSVTVDRTFINKLYDKYYKVEEDILTPIFMKEKETFKNNLKATSESEGE